MLTVLVPHCLGLALPIAFFLGIALTFGRMSRDSELDAFLAAGIGLHRLIRPLILASVALAVLIGAAVSYVEPYTRYAYKSMVEGLSASTVLTLVREGAFTTLGRMTVMVDDVKDGGHSFTGVFMYEEEGEGGSTVTTARAARLGNDATIKRFVLELDDGLRQTTLDPLGGGAEGRPDAITLRFRTLNATMEESALDVRPRGDHEREFTLVELWRTDAALPEGVNSDEIRAELHGRLFRVALVVVLPFLAVPLSLGRRRAYRSYGLAVGLAVLLLVSQLAQFGESIVEDGVVSPWLGIWLPFAGFAALSMTLFCKAAFSVNVSGSTDWLDAIVDGVARRYNSLRAKSS
jgi:lipopolysaccharide export system permease protein